MGTGCYQAPESVIKSNAEFFIFCSGIGGLWRFCQVTRSQRGMISSVESSPSVFSEGRRQTSFLGWVRLVCQRSRPWVVPALAQPGACANDDLAWRQIPRTGMISAKPAVFVRCGEGALAGSSQGPAQRSRCPTPLAAAAGSDPSPSTSMHGNQILRQPPWLHSRDRFVPARRITGRSPGHPFVSTVQAPPAREHVCGGCEGERGSVEYELETIGHEGVELRPTTESGLMFRKPARRSRSG